MPEIRVLPPDIVSRIAAGEVVERPASLIKELVENAIDAHATEIDIDLEEGGKKKVTVRDNGCGMSVGDLPLAFRSHATSKVRAEDASDCLFGVASLGFRGEALASIAAVGDVEVISRPPRAEHAFRLRPGRGEPEPAAGPPGTVIDVRNLFHNVPARRKFLRATTTELSHVLRQVTRLALGFPSIGFRLTHKGRKVLDLRRAADLRERVVQVLGPEKARHLLEVTDGGEADLPSLHGFIGSPELRRSDTKDQHFFVDGRWVRDRTLSHAVRSAFQGFLIPGQHPVCYLFLEFPPGGVDVNVHPMKTEVRFRDTGSIYPIVFHALRRALDAREDVADLSTSAGRPPSPGMAEPSETPGRGGAGDGTRRAALGFFASPRADERVEQRLFAPAGGARSGNAPGGSRSPAGQRSPSSVASSSPVAALFRGPGRAPRARAFQVLDTYLVLEEPDGVAFIDQHALHEKILFEGIHRSLLSGEVLKQKLLVPDVVEIRIEQVPLVERARRLLAPCGYDIALFGDREIAVHAVPKLLEQAKGPSSTREIVLEILRWLQDDGADVPGDAPVAEAPNVLSQPYRRLASMLACKRAVKAGARLAPEEIESLLDRADLAEDPRHCPHGRPTLVRISRKELEKKFDRK